MCVRVSIRTHNTSLGKMRKTQVVQGFFGVGGGDRENDVFYTHRASPPYTHQKIAKTLIKTRANVCTGHGPFSEIGPRRGQNDG